MAGDQKNPRRDAFVAWMKERKTNTSRVSAQALVPYTTLASFVQGATRNLSGENESKIARAFAVTVAEIFERAAPAINFRKTVPLVGYVGAGAEAHYYEAAELDQVDAPEDATKDTVAAEIRGTSLGPIFESWLVFWDEVRSPVTPDLIGELCVVGLPDGKVLVKRIKAARTPGLYHLESNTEPTLPDQEIDWAAKVTSIRPR